ncbi:MAG TPA: MFS transporter [Gaiella sp.]|jgi:MFS family permease
MPLSVTFGALAERRFRLLFGARTVSTLGSSMAEIALAFAVLDLGSPRDLGFVILAREIPIVVLLLLGGVWGDRLPRHLVLVGSDTVRGAAQGLCAVLLLTGNATVLWIALLQVVFGGASAFGRPAFQGLVPQTVAVERLQQANALLGLSQSTVAIAGPALGAIIVAAANPGWALAADAVTFGVSALLLLRISLPRTLRMTAASVLSDFRDGWREFVSRRWVVVMVVGFGVFQLTYFPALLVLGPYVAKTELGGAGAWGTILAVEALGSLVGGLFALRLRARRPLVATLVVVVPAAVQLMLLGVGAPLWLLTGVAFVSGVGFAYGGAVWFATLQEKIPEHAISRISSFDWFGSVALNPIGYALIGPLSEAIGVGESLVLAGVVNLASTFAMLAVPSVRALEAGPERHAAPAVGPGANL